MDLDSPLPETNEYSANGFSAAVAFSAINAERAEVLLAFDMTARFFLVYSRGGGGGLFAVGLMVVALEGSGCSFVVLVSSTSVAVCGVNAVNAAWALSSIEERGEGSMAESTEGCSDVLGKDRCTAAADGPADGDAVFLAIDAATPILNGPAAAATGDIKSW